MSRTLLVASALVFACACGEAEPSAPPFVGGDAGAAVGSDASTPQALPAPLIDPIAASTCGDTIALRGVAEPGSTVFVVGGADPSGLATDAHPQTGHFCLDVTLRPGVVNSLEVRAQDPQRGTSEAATLDIEHSPCTPDKETPEPSESKSENVALGQPVTTRDTPKKNQPENAADGDTQSYVEVGGSDGTFGWNDYQGWVLVDLGKMHELSKIVVRFRDSDGSGDKYATKYKVLVSPMSDPGDPNLSNGKWITVGSTGDGDGGVDRWDLSQTQPLARYVAVWLQQDGKPHWKENIGIPFVGKKYDEIFAISEIEVWNVPPKTQIGPPDTNSCASIGSP